MPKYRVHLPDGRVVDVPEGTDPAKIKDWVAKNAGPTPPPMAPVSSHEDAPARPIATGGGRGTGLDVRKSDQWAKENAPAIGATIAALQTGGLAAIPMAIGGGYGGSRLRGDTNEQALWEGAKQGVMEGAPKVIQGLSRVAYKSAIPKTVLDKFRKADVVGAGLENRAVLGTTQGVNAAEQGGARAAAMQTAAAPTVPTMTAQDIQAAFRPKYNRALVGGRPDKASEISQHVRTSMDQIGTGDMSGVMQLARKAELEPEAGSAMRAVSEKMAATNPQLANIERRAITQNLRRSPQMTEALNTAQANVGLKRAALAQEHSTPFTRYRSSGGILDALHLPSAASGAGIIGNEVSRALNPNVQRLLLSLMSGHQRDEEP